MTRSSVEFVTHKHKVVMGAIQQSAQHVARWSRTKIGDHSFLLGAGRNGNLGLRLALNFVQHLASVALWARMRNIPSV